MQKKVISFCVAIIVLFNIALPAYADGVDEEYLDEEAQASISQQSEMPLETLDIPAKSSILMEASTGQIVYDNNSHEAMPPASITKIMTLLLVMESIDNGSIALTDMVTCSENAASMGGTQIWLEPGETMSVDDLIKATAVVSANDASLALAEHVAGSEEVFVQRMNTRAQELGMNDTVFKNTTGLDAEGHVSSAYDIALMSQELLKHPKITEYTCIWMDSLRNGEAELVNTNKLVRYYDGCTGLKTGTTDEAGSCLSATATRGDISFIAVTMGSETSVDRFTAARTLLDYGFNGFAFFTPAAPELEPVSIEKGLQSQITPTVEMPSGYLITKGMDSQVTQEIIMQEGLTAPIVEGQSIGKIIYKLNETVLGEVDIVAENGVQRMSFFGAFILLVSALFSS